MSDQPQPIESPFESDALPVSREATDREVLEHYADLKAAAAEIDLKIDLMKPTVLEILARLNPQDRTVSLDGVGTFSVSTRATYTYPQDIVDVEDALKRRKKDAVRLGTATVAEAEFVIYRPLGGSEE